MSMFDPFKVWDEMLGIYRETVLGSKDERDIQYVTLEYTVPEELADELEQLVLEWFAHKGIELDEDDEDDAEEMDGKTSD